MTIHPAEAASSHPPPGSAEHLPDIEVRERGRARDGQPQFADRRLFMQLLVFRAAGASPSLVEPTIEGASRQRDPAALRAEGAAALLGRALGEAGVSAVVYEDVNDPFGIGVLSWTEDPSEFVTKVRPVLRQSGLGLLLRPEYTMLGRTYATGYEADLPHWLIERPRQTVLDPRHPWAIWYPLRRSGAFAKLSPSEQGSVLREHGVIGRAYAAKDLAHDVRLACHGLDARDNEFVIGLIGSSLHPLSHIVEHMRKTRQTSEFVSQMGPFFVGYAVERTVRP